MKPFPEAVHSGRKTRSAISPDLFFTSKGHPYIIDSKGKAKFISMEAAQEMEKRIEDPERYL